MIGVLAAVVLSGYVRAFDFSRTNAPPKAGQQSSAAAYDLRSRYAFSPRWSAGASYLFSNALNPGARHPDVTLPAAPLHTLYETYVQYAGSRFSAKLGDQLLSTPWANAADTRLKPAAYRAADLAYKLAPDWTAEAAYVDRFESRTASSFLRTTLLTPQTPTAGFTYARLGYDTARVSANAHAYAFSDIASAVWIDAKWTLRDPVHKTFLAVHGGSERNAGRALIGAIGSGIFGVQGGITPLHSVDITLGADDVYGGHWASPYTDSYTSDPLFTTSMTGGMIERRATGIAAKAAAAWSGNARRLRFIASYATYANLGHETDLEGAYYFNAVSAGAAYRGLLLRNRYGARTPYFRYNRTQLEYDF